MAVALMVGVLIGALGIGGLLLIPAVSVLAGLQMQTAMATALLTFIATGILGTILFHRRGSIEWRLTVPLCAGAAMFGFFGAWANSRMDGRVLTLILAALIILAGCNTVLKKRSPHPSPWLTAGCGQQSLLFGIGAVAGFGSGLTGVGGPALSVPLMLLFGFSPLTSIGASQVVQILAAVSGTVGNLRYGTIDVRLAMLLTVFEVIGVLLGVRIVHTLKPGALRGMVGVFCILVGVGLLLRALQVV